MASQATRTVACQCPEEGCPGPKSPSRSPGPEPCHWRLSPPPRDVDEEVASSNCPKMKDENHVKKMMLVASRAPCTSFVCMVPQRYKRAHILRQLPFPCASLPPAFLCYLPARHTRTESAMAPTLGISWEPPNAGKGASSSIRFHPGHFFASSSFPLVMTRPRGSIYASHSPRMSLSTRLCSLARVLPPSLQLIIAHCTIRAQLTIQEEAHR